MFKPFSLVMWPILMTQAAQAHWLTHRHVHPTASTGVVAGPQPLDVCGCVWVWGRREIGGFVGDHRVFVMEACSVAFGGWSLGRTSTRV